MEKEDEEMANMVPVVYVPKTHFYAYAKQAEEANVHRMEELSKHKAIAFTRMTGGSKLDVFGTGMGLYQALACSRQRKMPLCGLSMRIPKRMVDGALKGVFAPFFDLDFKTSEILTLDMVTKWVNDVIFPCFRTFFEFQSGQPGLHLGIVTSVNKRRVMMPEVKRSWMCGWCRENELTNDMWGSTPVAECSACGLRFPRSIGVNMAGKEPILVSLPTMIQKYNRKNITRHITTLDEFADWTPLTDPSVCFDKTRCKLTFLVNARSVSVMLPPAAVHFERVRRKYGVHIFGLHKSQTYTETRKNDLAAKRYGAFLAKTNKQDTSAAMDAFIEYERRRRVYLNKQQDPPVFEAKKITRLHAESRAVQLFGKLVYRTDKHIRDVARHFLNPATLFDMGTTQDIFLHFMSYTLAQAIKHQTTLPDQHPFRSLKMKQDVFDATPVVSGTALRVPLGEGKPTRCKCPDVSKTNRKRGSNGRLLASKSCTMCFGNGFYVDRSRPPSSLVRILVDPQHEKYEDLQRTADKYMPVLNQKRTLAMKLALLSTRVDVRGLTKFYKRVTPTMAELLTNVAPIGTVSRGGLGQDAITTPALLEIVQTFIQTVTRVRQWRHLVVTGLMPLGQSRVPRFGVKVESTGDEWCIFRHSRHETAKIYFRLHPPNKGQKQGTLYAACWGANCRGHWSKCLLEDRESWLLTEADTGKIWSKFIQRDHAPTSFLAAAASSIYSHKNQPSRPTQPDQEPDQPDQPDQPKQTIQVVQLSFREQLRKRPKLYRTFLSGVDNMRLAKDTEDPEPLLHRARWYLNMTT